MDHELFKVILDVVTVVFTAGVIYATLRFTGKLGIVNTALKGIEGKIDQHVEDTRIWRGELHDRVQNLESSIARRF